MPPGRGPQPGYPPREEGGRLSSDQRVAGVSPPAFFPRRITRLWAAARRHSNGACAVVEAALGPFFGGEDWQARTVIGALGHGEVQQLRGESDVAIKAVVAGEVYGGGAAHTCSIDCRTELSG